MRLIGVLSFVMFASPAWSGSLVESLTLAQKQALERGEQIFVTEEDPSSAWPKSWVYQLLHATSEEAMAVFFDYEGARHYIPNVKKSQISKVIDARTHEVDYVLSIPILSDEWYTARNTLSTYTISGGQSGYRVDWELLRARTTRATEGYARVEPYGTGAVFGYYNFVTPGASLSGVVRGKALKQVKDTVRAFVKRVEHLRSESPDVLRSRIEALRSAIAR